METTGAPGPSQLPVLTFLSGCPSQASAACPRAFLSWACSSSDPYGSVSLLSKYLGGLTPTCRSSLSRVGLIPQLEGNRPGFWGDASLGTIIVVDSAFPEDWR